VGVPGLDLGVTCLAQHHLGACEIVDELAKFLLDAERGERLGGHDPLLRACSYAL
jgi:hypothetical protein